MTGNIWTEPEQSRIARLYALADVADREYEVRSAAPLLGPLIVWVRRNLTTHLREAYFDPVFERQAVFNRQIADALCAAWQFLKDRAAARLPHVAIAEPQTSATARDLVARAAQLVETLSPFPAALWAGPLPEYGECLGRAFYCALHAAYLLNEPQTQTNLELLTAIQQLAAAIEAEPRWIAKFYTESLVPEVRPTDYRVHSETRFVGPLIVWLRRTLTSHLREAYVDPILERQVVFNRQLQAALRDAAALDRVSVAELRAAAEVLCDYHIWSSVLLLGPFIAWARRRLTAHLDIPYIVPTLERQAAFNRAVVEVLAVIRQQAADLRLRESAAGPTARQAEIARDAARLQAQMRDLEKSTPEQGEFNAQIAALLAQIHAWVLESRL